MQFKFAMLEILAKRPEGCATIDELWREWETAAEGKGTADRFLEFENVDVLRTGLVVASDDTLHITDAGRSVVRALESLGDPSTKSGAPNQSQSLKAIDDLIGTELRLKIFNLGLRAPGESPDLEPLEDEQDVEPVAIQAQAEATVADETEAIASQNAKDTAEDHDLGRPGEIDAPDFVLPNAPSFLKRNSTSGIQTHARSARRRLNLPVALTSHFERFSRILRGHLAEGSSNVKTEVRPAGVGGAVLAALSLLVLLIGAGLFIGVNQIKSLKSEITALERQLAPLRKQAADADQQEKKHNIEQKNQVPMPSATEKSKNPADSRATPSALVLSPDEARLIREYIKPAPFTGPAGPPINVGDPVTIATIPLPSPLTDKVPKLLGARFTIRNGAIVILKRDSRQADVVLAPN